MTDTQQEAESDTDVFESSSSDAELATASDWISLPPCDLLSVERADEFLRWRTASTIAIVGERKGGKTTLITEIYERFLRGPFAAQQFSYSQTLFGFEKRSYPSRADSGAHIPETDRTSRRDGLLFFHLGLTSLSDGVRRDLLLTERAGETYRDVRDRPNDSEQLIELKKAAVVAFILDGERVTDGRTRSEAFASVRGTLRAFVDSGRIAHETAIQLITTKFDLLDENGDALKALSEFEERFVRKWEEKFSSLTCWRTAARDPRGKMEPAWGIAPLLQSWIGAEKSVSQTDRPVPQLNDEFDRLLLRAGTGR